jgi:hypothetical protein
LFIDYLLTMSKTLSEPPVVFFSNEQLVTNVKNFRQAKPVYEGGTRAEYAKAMSSTRVI